MYFNILVSRNT